MKSDKNMEISTGKTKIQKARSIGQNIYKEHIKYSAL